MLAGPNVSRRGEQLRARLLTRRDERIGDQRVGDQRIGDQRIGDQRGASVIPFAVRG